MELCRRALTMAFQPDVGTPIVGSRRHVRTADISCQRDRFPIEIQEGASDLSEI